MVTLAAGRNVPRVAPQADPGVRVPTDAFTSDLGAAAQELAPGAEALANVAIRQQTRRGTIHRSKQRNALGKRLPEIYEAFRVDDNEDLQSEETLARLGTAYRTAAQELEAEHGGTKSSKESRAQLTLDLQDMVAKAQG